MADRGNSCYTLHEIKVVPHGSPKSPDIHDLSKGHHLYDLDRHTELLLDAKNLLHPTSLTVLTLTPNNYP